MPKDAARREDHKENDDFCGGCTQTGAVGVMPPYRSTAFEWVKKAFAKKQNVFEIELRS